MNKKNIRANVALFMGLLCFHTFSSCAGTRQALGEGTCSTISYYANRVREYIPSRPTMGAAGRTLSQYGIKKCLSWFLFGSAVTAAVSGGAICIWHASKPGPSSSAVTPTAPPTSNSSATDQTYTANATVQSTGETTTPADIDGATQFFNKSIEEGDKKGWG